MSHVKDHVVSPLRNIAGTKAAPVNMPGRHTEHILKLCVSGATETGSCGLEAYEIGKELGRQVAQQGSILTTGAGNGFPLYAAIGAKEAGGFSIGFSPAGSEREHLETYRLPLDYMDLIVYTGFGYSGRSLMLTRSSDAVIIGCGKIGTINEFTLAYEAGVPVGILQGSWQTDPIVNHVINESRSINHKVVFDTDARALVERLIEIVKKDRENVAYVNHHIQSRFAHQGNGNEEVVL